MFYELLLSVALLGNIQAPADKPLKPVPEAKPAIPTPLYITDETVITLDGEEVSSLSDIPKGEAEVVGLTYAVDEETKRCYALRISFRKKSSP